MRKKSKGRNPSNFMLNPKRGGKGTQGRSHMHGRKGRKR